jgi:hypothetical protein
MCVSSLVSYPLFLAIAMSSISDVKEDTQRIQFELGTNRYTVHTPTQVPLRGSPNYFVWSPDGKWLLIRSVQRKPENEEVHSVWDPKSGRVHEIYNSSMGGSATSYWDVFGAALFASSEDINGMRLRRWELGTWKPSIVLTGRRDDIWIVPGGHRGFREGTEGNGVLHDSIRNRKIELEIPPEYQDLGYPARDRNLALFCHCESNEKGLIYNLRTGQWIKVKNPFSYRLPVPKEAPFIVSTYGGVLRLIERLPTPPSGYPKYRSREIANLGKARDNWSENLNPKLTHMTWIRGDSLMNSRIQVLPLPRGDWQGIPITR